MSRLESDTIDVFNAMIEKQKKEAGEAMDSTVFFDNESVVTHDRLPQDKVPCMIENVCKTLQWQQSKYGWEFLFLGANIDAAANAKRFGISAGRAANYKCDEKGTALHYEVISEAVCSIRACRPLSTDWKQRIGEDVQNRGR